MIFILIFVFVNLLYPSPDRKVKEKKTFLFNLKTFDITMSTYIS